MRFKDREHAGCLLAERLGHLRDSRPVVLGLTNGGIPVAFEVARGLGAPLDLIVIRKLRAPSAPELSIGAIAEGGVTFVNPTLLRDSRVKPDDAAAVADAMVAELALNVRLYRGATPPPSLHGRVVVIVDDFVSTGSSARAAALAARRRGAVRVVLAVPVIRPLVEPELRGDFDEVVALQVSEPQRPASDAYQRFGSVGDDVALEYLRRARQELVIEEALEPAAPP